jgi:hypothetical protein
MAKPRCVCGCGGRIAHWHHAVTRQELRKHGGDPKDPRNLVPVTLQCHGGHHSGARRLRLSVLPDSVFEFARELMDAGPAYEYLGRFYAGSDPRLDALLAETV